MTSPLPLTVATAGLDEAQANVCPARTLPAVSYAWAVSCTVEARPASEVVAGVTVILATEVGWATVTSAPPRAAPSVAVILAVPGPIAVTIPPFTVATARLDDAQVKLRPVSSTLLAS